MRKDKETTYRVRLGVCLNQVTSQAFRCTEPTTWYFDQKFTYNAKAPQKLAVPPPPIVQKCLELR